MKKLIGPLLALVAILAAAATLSPSAPALANSSVQIQDDANVLSSSDKQNITDAATSAPFAVIVWTNSSYQNKDDFYAAVRSKATNDTVVVGVDPIHKFSHISASANTRLTGASVTQADALANAQFGNKAWAAGLAAAINSLAGVAPAGNSNTTGNPGNSTSSNPAPVPVPSSSPGLGGFSLALCLVPLLIIVGLAFFLRKRFAGNRGVGQTPMNQGTYNPNANQEYGQGPNNQGYGPGYGPGYNQGQGGSGVGGNIASGAVGALGGAALGYELGKHQGDAQAQDNQGNNQPGSIDYGGSGTVDSAGGGSGPDFGSGGTVDSGGSDFGGGADFGGGDSGSSSGDF